MRAGKAQRERVVADPGLEEVAQDVERVGRRRLLGEEALEERGDFRPRLLEVQIGDEERAALQTRSAFSMTTGVVGTFWWPPRCRGDLLDLVDHVLALDHLAEHGVAQRPGRA